jgi:hypothetical protein
MVANPKLPKPAMVTHGALDPAPHHWFTPAQMEKYGADCAITERSTFHDVKSKAGQKDESAQVLITSSAPKSLEGLPSAPVVTPLTLAAIEELVALRNEISRLRDRVTGLELRSSPYQRFGGVGHPGLVVTCTTPATLRTEIPGAIFEKRRTDDRMGSIHGA